MADDKNRPARPGKRPPSNPPLKPRKPPMTEPKPASDSVFEIGRIRRLVELMKEHDLSEVDLRESRQRIRICRGPKDMPRLAPPSPPSPSAPSPQSPTPVTSVPADAANIAVIKSPMVGTFYSRPNPKAEPYIKVGDRVDTTTIVCIIEAMKVFNVIKAETSGTIAKVLIQDGQPVEHGTVLFLVKPA